MAEPVSRHPGLHVPRLHLTILFSDVSGSLQLASSVEPEDSLDVGEHLRRCSERVVSKYGGIVLDAAGDGVMIVFGLKGRSEQDGRRATEAALELHEAIRHMPVGSRTQPSLALHSGIHCGLVVFTGNPSPGQYNLGGPAAGVAKRLSDMAKRNEILVSATTLGGESHFFDIRDRGVVALPLTDEETRPIAVLQVLGRSSVVTRFQARTRRGLTPFVGRARELRLLSRSLAEATADRACEVAVVAPAGVGKTRLIDDFLQAALRRPVFVCRGYCEGAIDAAGVGDGNILRERGEPLQPFLQMLRQLARQEAGDTPVAAENGRDSSLPQDDARATTFPELQRALSVGLQRQTVPAPALLDQVAGALCDLVAALAAKKPLILFIDDWQWADDASKHVLSRIRALKGRMLILTASREPLPDEQRSPQIHVLDLAQLDREETIEAILKLRPDADHLAVEKILQLSGGRPLYIEELCHFALRLGASSEIEIEDSVPTLLARLVESRVDQLPSRLSELVRAAAVIGTVIPVWLLEQVTGSGGDGLPLSELAEKDLIYPGEVEGTLRFKHGITRDVIYKSVGRAERERLHHTIAGLLDRRRADGDGHDELLEPLAYHFRGAGALDRAAQYAELAGDKALAAAALDRARSHYADALASLDLLPPSDSSYQHWSRIVHRLSLACVFDPTRDQIRVFDRAAAMARQRDDKPGMAWAEYWLGFIHYALGDPRDAVHHYERAQSVCGQALSSDEGAEGQSGALEMKALGVQLKAAVGQALAAAGDYSRALALLDEALDEKKRHRRNTRAAVASAYALACKGAVLGDLGEFARAHQCFEEALEASVDHRAVKSSVIGWRSAVYLWQGRWQDALEAATEAQRLGEGVGSLYVPAMGRSVTAYAKWMLTQDPSSLDAMARATSWLEARGMRLSISMSYGWLADVAAAMGDGDHTRTYAEKAIEAARSRDDRLGEAMGYRALAKLPAAAVGCSPDEAMEKALVASRQRTPREEPITWLLQAQQAVCHGQRADAYRLLESAIREFTRMDMAWHLAEATQCLTELGAVPS